MVVVFLSLEERDDRGVGVVDGEREGFSVFGRGIDTMVGEQQLDDLCMSICSCGSEEDVVVHSRIGERGGEEERNHVGVAKADCTPEGEPVVYAGINTRIREQEVDHIGKA